MAFKDEFLRCAACGKSFVYTVREQRARAEQGLSKEPPAFCPECRGSDVRLRGALAPANGVERSEPRAPGGDSRTEGRTMRPAGPRPADPRYSPRRDDGPDRRSGPPRFDGGQRGGYRPEGGRPDRRPGGPGRPEGQGGRGGGRPGGFRGGGRPKTGGRGPAGARRGPERARQQELRIRYTGVVKWFDDTRGFGFIAQEEGDEVFVHSSGIIVEKVTSLHEGQPVEYEVERTMRGLQAVDVIPLAW